MAKVIICVPHGGTVPPEFYRSVTAMQLKSLQHTFVFGEIDMITVGKARNELVRQAITNDQDVAFFIDDDVLIPDNAGILIEQAMELKIVSGLYFSRRPPYTPQLYKLALEEKFAGSPSPLYWAVDSYAPGLSQFDAVGGGCLAIKCSAFKEMEDHFTEHERRHKQYLKELEVLLLDLFPERGDLQQKVNFVAANHTPLSPWFEFLDLKGEDLYFCERARDAGISIWGNTDVKCTHLAQVPIGEAHFQYLKDNGLLRRVD